MAQINCQISDELKTSFDVACAKHKIKKTQAITDLIQKFVNEHP